MRKYNWADESDKELKARIDDFKQSVKEALAVNAHKEAEGIEIARRGL